MISCISHYLFDREIIWQSLISDKLILSPSLETWTMNRIKWYVISDTNLRLNQIVFVVNSVKYADTTSTSLLWRKSLKHLRRWIPSSAISRCAFSLLCTCMHYMYAGKRYHHQGGTKIRCCNCFISLLNVTFQIRLNAVFWLFTFICNFFK